MGKAEKQKIRSRRAASDLLLFCFSVFLLCPPLARPRVTGETGAFFLR